MLKLMTKPMLLACMLVILFIPLQVFAAGASPEMETQQDDNGSMMAAHGKKHPHGHRMFMVHKDAYILLLAEKFTPEQLQVWQDTIKESRELRAKRHEMMKKMNKEEKKQFLSDMKKEWASHGKDMKKTHKAFHAAVENWLDNGNADGIKQVMPMLLEKMQAHNQHMKQKLE